MAPITRATAQDAGCWIDGHWGQYAAVRLCELATAHGGPAFLSYGVGEAMDSPVDARDHDGEMWAADDALSWMNDHVAPQGFYFDWCEGELFLWSDDDWAEVQG